MSIRRRGILAFVSFGGLFALFIFWMLNPDSYPFSYMPAGPGGAILIGTPLALCLAGLTEAATGHPFHELEKIWIDLNWWQRGIMGSILVATLGGVLVLGMVLTAVDW